MDANWLVRADAAVEAALGLALLAGAGTGVFAGGDFPHPVGTTLVVVVGVLLLALGALLWRAPVSPRALAAGNLATAILAVVWLAAERGFSTAGAAFVGAVVAALLCLAAAQLACRR